MLTFILEQRYALKGSTRCAAFKLILAGVIGQSRREAACFEQAEVVLHAEDYGERFRRSRFVGMRPSRTSSAKSTGNLVSVGTMLMSMPALMAMMIASL